MQLITVIIATTLAGLSAASPAVLDTRYVPGSCGVHVTQWQKNENGVGADYQFDVYIKDAIGTQIGGASRLAIPTYVTKDVSSDLPNPLRITAGAVDGDPVQFEYNGYHFSSSAGCSTGKYDGGNRDSEYIVHFIALSSRSWEWWASEASFIPYILHTPTPVAEHHLKGAGATDLSGAREVVRILIRLV
ncbi:hypothetical protein NUW58_g7476 [Xylaria curta]|uniref:Uncharacterized protein n=1 Tax=Xylaria curta TaxID=42375 RepID=A0ACC1NHS6_9PEZI|nr:hypothetical protein NUW58_g7476 [Xylaria curta]